MRYSEKICKSVLIFLDVGQDQDQTDQIWSRNWKSHAGKIPAASGSQPLKKGVFPFNGSKKSRIKKSRCNQKSLFACPFTTRKNFWNLVKNAALTTKRRISVAVGYIPPEVDRRPKPTAEGRSFYSYGYGYGGRRFRAIASAEGALEISMSDSFLECNWRMLKIVAYINDLVI